MITHINTKYKVILASQSPRRRQLLTELGIQHQVRVKDGILEDFPADMNPEMVAQYLSEKKYDAYLDDIHSGELYITADTIVLLGNEILGKPQNKEEAEIMLTKLSGRTHTVITGVTIGTNKRKISFDSRTQVSFSNLRTEDIQTYIRDFRPFDKAGSYGIQEWIGYIGVERIDGSFYNVMGLPIQLLYQKLIEFAQE